MAKNLLFEIGLEEVPARFVRGAIEQLEQKVEKWLVEHRISFNTIQAYATPRRLAIYINQLADMQTDIEEEAKGPAKKIAQDAEGHWSKAALGFARSQGVEPDALYFQELNGIEYVYATKSSKGVETASLLADGIKEVILSMTFPKNMRWGKEDLKFVRPIRWLVALLDSDVIDFEIAGVKTGRVSRGHRFLGQETTINNAVEYVDKLKEQFVIVDMVERQTLIEQQIANLATEHNWKIAVKDDLLEEVLFLVEWPSALFGTFDESFLSIPQEVLITSMREHQRYFPVLDQNNTLLPFFVTVRNGNNHALEQVSKGNEKVLRARLSDAKFFYEEDHKLTIDFALSKLDKIVYHEELGSVGDKVKRVVAISDAIAARLNVENIVKKQVSRAASIAKFDLVSQMVYEFPELQGIMGEDYATRLGEDKVVAKAINEHYQPRFSGDGVPSHIVGSIVSLAEKIDTIVGCFSIGIVPTGSQDPYALRRHASGIVQIVIVNGLSISLDELFNLALAIHEQKGTKRSTQDIVNDLTDFFGLRVKNWLSEHGAKYDVIDAVMAVGYGDLTLTKARALFIMNQVEEHKEQFKSSVEAFNRVCNLASKATTTSVNEALLVESTEQELYTVWKEATSIFNLAIQSYQLDEAYNIIAKLQPAIVNYFDSVMVMAKEEDVKQNRLATLNAIAEDINKLADLSKLVWA